MSDYRSKYQEISGTSVNNLRDAQINAIKSRVIDSFFESPSYYQVTINSSPTPSDVWIVDDSEQKEQKLLLTKPGDNLSFGDCVLWNGDYWLTTIIDDMSGIYKRGVIRKTVDSIKWQDSNGDIKEAPFFLTTDFSRTLGINEGQFIIMPDDKRYIAMQNNADTQKLKVGDRFIFDNCRSWKCTSLNYLHSGLIYMTLEEYAIDTAKDNVDLRICNYITHNYTIAITNGQSISLNTGSTLQLNTTVTDNGNAISSPSLTYDSSDSTIASVTNSGLITALSEGSVVITCTLANDTSIKSTISVDVVAVVSDSYSVSISGNSVIKQNQSATFTSSVTNNGIVVNDQLVTFDVFADDKVSATSLALITSQDGKSCVVKNNNTTNGYVQVRCMLQSDNSVIGWTRIQMKSLI